MLRWLALGLALALIGCSSNAAPPGRMIKGTVEATLEAEAIVPSALWLAPAEGAAAEPGVEAALRDALDWCSIEVAPDAPFVLRYAYAGVPATLDDPSLGIGVGGVFGSSGGHDVGLGVELPIFSDRRGDEGIAFRLDLALERRDGTRLWRGRADGLARPLPPRALLRPVALLLLNRLGETAPRQGFTK